MQEYYQFTQAEANEFVLMVERKNNIDNSTDPQDLEIIAIRALTKTLWMCGPATLNNPYDEGKRIGRLLWIAASRPFVSNYFKTRYFPDYLAEARAFLSVVNHVEARSRGVAYFEGLQDGFKSDEETPPV